MTQYFKVILIIRKYSCRGVWTLAGGDVSSAPTRWMLEKNENLRKSITNINNPK
jgi:hypothetical protein